MFGKHDPVCGVRISRNTCYKAEYRGKTYYFDCDACKHTFEENPEVFVGKKGKGLLETLAEHQDGMPKSCHSVNR